MLTLANELSRNRRIDHQRHCIRYCGKASVFFLPSVLTLSSTTFRVVFNVILRVRGGFSRGTALPSQRDRQENSLGVNLGPRFLANARTSTDFLRQMHVRNNRSNVSNCPRRSAYRGYGNGADVVLARVDTVLPAAKSCYRGVGATNSVLVVVWDWNAHRVSWR